MVALPAHPPKHPWKLVGPWWRWPRAAFPADGRLAAPAIQKFAGAGFIPGFLADPQHSLVFDAEVDVVSTVDLLPAVSGGNLVGKLAALFATKPDGTPVKPAEATTPEILSQLHRARLVPSGLRKLYQPAHDRHYLVVCELHCDVPGFPTVPRAEFCQAGFVVRRRQRVVPPALVKEAAERAQSLRRAEAGLAELKQQTPLRDDLAAARKASLVAMEADGTLAPAILAAETAVASERAELNGWFDTNGITVRVEAWIPATSGPGTRGAWTPLADEAADPAKTGEHVLPLFPLIAPPGDARHDAAGRTINYGLIPTASLQHDANGHSRFEDASTYEIRCFVRRHKPCCPPTGRVPDCHGEVVWSAPTEPYRVAAPFDPVGSANRPISIKMPDLRELAAQIAARPRGKLSPVRVIQPQHLSPKVKDGAASGGTMGGKAVCFFSIPLITIVALFVLNLFLPIVVFVFQLWFLLLFRFCIPPQVKFDAALDAKLAATPPSVDLDLDFKVSVDGVSLASASELQAALTANLRAKIEANGVEAPGDRLDAFSNNALGTMHRGMADNAALADGVDDPEDAPTAAAGFGALVYEPRRQAAWRLVEGRG
ncbi:hypothetical protein [Falsiroseomonas sp. HW251]|uniref:hypothetical protein n=1 Tax=Falsiroseomonas sp. HW251 TaxID=3390998 RepID=UPI003D314A23